jgi:hypothetical protein
MSKTITYEVVGNYVRVTDAEAVRFLPILEQASYYFPLTNNTTGITAGLLSIPITKMTPNGENVVHKPSLEELKANIMKVMGVTASGGRRSRKTRRRHK